MKMEVEFDTILEMVDTFGIPCEEEDCEEIRTAGLSIAVVMSGNKPEQHVIPLCQEHLFAWVEENVFGRTHGALISAEGEVFEKDHREQGT